MNITAISLKDTGHVVATYTNNSGNEVDSKDFARRFVNGVPLRLIGQTGLIPVAAGGAAGTKSPPKGLSPRSVSFGLPARVMQTALVETEQPTLLSRPLEQSVIDGELIETPAAPSAIENLTFEVTNTGVQVTLTPKEIDSASGARSTLAFATPIVCVMRTQKESASVVSSAVLPSKENPGDESTVRIPFAVIPEGTNSFLFFLKGFQPIWDQLDASNGRKRSWSWPQTSE